MPITKRTPSAKNPTLLAGEHVSPNTAKSQRLNQGVTLVELLVTLAIAIILAGLAAPSFTNLIQQLRLSALVGELRNAMNLARTEAIKRNGKVDLIAADGNWERGWFVESPENDRILFHGPVHKDFRMSAKFTDGGQHIAYNGAGRTRTKNSSNAPQTGHIQVSLGDHSRLIVINFLGRVRVCNPATDKNCTTTTID